MSEKALVFEAPRTGYGIDQVSRPMTVGELRALLEDLDDDMAIICSHDSGYTYGSLSRTASIREENEDGEWEDIDELNVW